MALEVRTLRDGSRPAAIIADRRLWLTADRTTVVEDGDVRAAFLLAGQGGEIPAADVERLGLAADDNGRVVGRSAEPLRPAETDDKPRPAETEEKARSAPNKARRKGEDK